MAESISAIPKGYHSITPALTCKGAAKAIDFYKQAFGAKEISRMEMPGGMIGHAELQIGDSKIFVSDEFPGMSSGPDSNSKGPSSYLFLYTEDVDSVYNHAVSAGCTATMPLQNQFWGDRTAWIMDPAGHGGGRRSLGHRRGRNRPSRRRWARN